MALAKSFSHLNTLSYLKNYVQLRHGMLVFNNEEAFKIVVAQLYQAIYKASSQSLKLVDSNPQDFVLEQFENLFGHNSLRRYINYNVKRLLLADSLTEENDPEDYFFPDKIIRSIANMNLEFAIAGQVVSLKEHQRDYQRLRSGGKVEGAFMQVDRFSGPDMYSGTQSQMSARVAGGVGLEIKDISKLCTNQNLRNCRIWVSSIVISPECERVGPLRYNWWIYDNAQPNPTLLQTFLGQPTDYINYIFPKAGSYRVCVQAFNDQCESNIYCEWFDFQDPAPPTTPTCCTPFGEQTQRFEYRSKRQVRTRLLLMTVIPFVYTSITAATRAYKKGALGLVWWPHRVRFLSVQLLGSYNELWCNGPFKNMPTYTDSGNNRMQASVLHYSYPPIYVKYHSVKSRHSLTDGSTNYPIADQYICQR